MSGAQEPPVGPPADAGPASVPGRRRAARPQPPPAGFAEPVDAPPTTAFTSPRRSLAERARRGTTPPGHASAANRSTPADVRPETTGRGATDGPTADAEPTAAGPAAADPPAWLPATPLPPAAAEPDAARTGASEHGAPGLEPVASAATGEADAAAAGRAPEDEPEPAPAAAGPAGPARRAGAAPSGRAGAASGGRAGRRRARHSAGKASLPAGLSPRERSRPGLARVLLTALSAILSATVLLVCGVGYAAVRFYDGKVDRTTLRTERVEGTRPPQVQHGRETWLLVGSDVRTGSDAAEVGGARSDTMIIAILGAHGDTTLVSIPRDLRVTIPAYTDDDGDRHRSRTDKVNAAFSLGGPTLLLRTLENVTGLRIDHFAEIDFNGFRQMSSALGGVEVCLVEDPFVERFTDDRRRVVRSTNLNDPSSGFVGHPGVNVLEGENALAFVRQRHGFADGDLSRIRRQQAFLGAVFRKVTSGDFLTDPAKLTRFLSAVTEATVLDDDTSISDLRVLAERLRGMSSGQVRFTTIPLSGSIARPVYYLTYDEATVRAFFEQIVEADKAGDDDGGATGQPGAPAPGASPTASPTPTVAPAEIRLTVLNGTPTGGMGTEAANTLRTAGYHIVAVDGTEERDALRTEVRYAAGSDTDAAAAARLVEDVPGARAVPDPALTPGGITLVIGQDYVDGDTTIVAAAASAGRASATPSASPRAYYTQAPVTAAEGCVK